MKFSQKTYGLSGWHFLLSFESGAKQDLLAVRRLLSTRAQSERQLDRLQQRMLDKTEHELSDEGISKAIARVAEELLARQSISGRSVQHIYEQVSQ